MTKLAFEEATDYILKACEKRFSDVVVHASRSQAKQIKFVNSEISAGRIWMDQSVSVFVAKGKRVATTSILDLERKTVDGTIAKLEKFIAKSEPNAEYGGIAEGHFAYKEVQNAFDPRIPKLTGDELAGFVEEGIGAALAHGAKRASGSLEITHSREMMKTSGGAHGTQKGTSAIFSIRAFAEKDASGHKLSCVRSMQHFRPGETGQKAGEFAKESLNPVPGEAGKFDILFDPMAIACLLQHVGDSASIFSVEAGFSFLENRLNKRVASDIVTIFDEGTLAGGMGSTKFDAEGVRAQKTTLIRFGILRNYLHNTSTAKRYKVNTTGNAGIIAPHPWNIVLDNGNYDSQEMIQQTKHGLYVTNLWYTRFQNYKTGEFSTIPRDAIFRVENGRVVGAVKGIRISEKMSHLLMGIEAISQRREQILGWEVETPVKCGHVLARHVNVTKSTEKAGA